MYRIINWFTNKCVLLGTYVVLNFEDVVALLYILFQCWFIHAFLCFLIFDKIYTEFVKKHKNDPIMSNRLKNLELLYWLNRRKAVMFIYKPTIALIIYFFWSNNYIFLYKQDIILTLQIIMLFLYFCFFYSFNKRDPKKLRDYLNLNKKDIVFYNNVKWTNETERLYVKTHREKFFYEWCRNYY